MSNACLASRSCLSSFKALQLALKDADEHISDTLPLAEVEAQQGQFRVWCGNLGALQKGPASLDYRLRGFETMKSTTIQLLEQLQSHLAETISVVNGIRPAFEDQPMSDDSSEVESESAQQFDDEPEDTPPKELEMRFSRIQSIMKNLYKLGFRIRDPHTRAGSQKASSYTQFDPETGVDLFDQFSRIDELHVEHLLKVLRQDAARQDASLDTIGRRLAASNTVRRRQFKYWERHAKKLADTDEDDDDDNEKSKTENKVDGTTLSRTEASNRYNIVDDGIETATIITAASTAIDFGGNSVDIPAPPVLARQADFVCPYCHVLCENKYGRGKAWRTHVLHDLQPYVCTYEECPTGAQLYSSRSAWLQHERSAHRRAWKCFEHSLQFRGASALKTHLEKQHTERYTPPQLKEIVDQSWIGLPDDRLTCPICLVKSPFLRGLENHLANHLERFALFALPQDFVENDEGSMNTNGSSVTYDSALSGKNETSSNGSPREYSQWELNIMEPSGSRKSSLDLVQAGETASLSSPGRPDSPSGSTTHVHAATVMPPDLQLEQAEYLTPIFKRRRQNYSLRRFFAELISEPGPAVNALSQPTEAQNSRHQEEINPATKNMTNNYEDNEEIPGDDTGLERLHIDRNWDRMDSHTASQKRRASSPPEDDFAVESPSGAGPAELLRRRAGM